MTTKEINELSLSDICYILLNEKECYSPSEIELLEQRKKELSKDIEQEEYQEEVESRPELFKCPKCEGINNSNSSKCVFCGYEFKRKDYFNNETENNNESSNFLLYIIALFIPIVGIILGIIYIHKDEDDLGKKLILFSILVFAIAVIILNIL